MKITYSMYEYIEKNQERKNIYAKFSNGELLYNHNGQWITADEYEIEYPKYEYRSPKYKGENPDTTSFA